MISAVLQTRTRLEIIQNVEDSFVTGRRSAIAKSSLYLWMVKTHVFLNKKLITYHSLKQTDKNPQTNNHAKHDA